MGVISIAKGGNLIMKIMRFLSKFHVGIVKTMVGHQLIFLQGDIGVGARRDRLFVWRI